MTITIPTPKQLSELTKHRNVASVSIYIASPATGGGESRSPIGQDPEPAQLALRSAANKAYAELQAAGVSQADQKKIQGHVLELLDDRTFWATPARSIAVFISPDEVFTFRLMNELPQYSAVGDRYDIGPLLRAITFGHSGYVLAVTVGDVRLTYLSPDASYHQVDLPTLPEDASEVFEKRVTTGRFSRHRADGTLGPKVEQKRYCSIVQDAVKDVIEESHVPLVLAAAADLEPAYREINTYKSLLKKGIDANPTSLSIEDLAKRGREILDKHFEEKLEAWRERFGSLRANGSASTQLSDVARSATAGQVDTLYFDLEFMDEGSIDEQGVISFAETAGPETYGLIDEIASRVLLTGGTVKAVRRQDLPDSDSPVAATFRN